MTNLRRYFPGLLAAAGLATALAAATADEPAPAREAPTEFHFVRMMYIDAANGRRNFGPGWWQQDWREAEDHFNFNLARMTRISVGDPQALPLGNLCTGSP